MDSLLIISDEPALAETLASELPELALESASFAQSSTRMGQKPYRLIVIDEDTGGAIAETGKLPVLRLSRPVTLSDLLYTIRERLQGKTAGAKEELALGANLRFLPAERMLKSDGAQAPIPLTEKETELLQCLLEAEGEPVTREQLLQRVWGYSDDIATHTLETHIYRLRGKLRQADETLDIAADGEGGYTLGAPLP